jgi:hypothetical protein
LFTQGGRMLAPGGWALAERPVRAGAVDVIVIDVPAQDQPRVPLVDNQHPVQALTAGTGDPVGAGNPVTSRDLGVFVDHAAEPVLFRSKIGFSC